MLPEYSVQVDGQGTVVSDQLNTYVQSGAGLVANLRSFIGITGVVVYIVGYTAPGDGGQGSFYWNATGTAPDDNGVTTIIPNGSAAGQGEWTRVGQAAASSALPSPAIFAASGTLTLAGQNIKVTLVGAGGGGAGGLINATTPVGGGGGGGGAVAVKWFRNLTVNNTLNITVGTPGTGGVGGSSPTGGGNGVASTIASGSQAITTVTAGGGLGATVSAGASTGGGGGTATNGDINANGGMGGDGTPGTPTFGGNGIGANGGATAGYGSYGFGGFGGFADATVATNGQGGTAGIVVVEYTN